MKKYNINIPLEVKIDYDGYYPYCKKCGYFDLDYGENMSKM